MDTSSADTGSSQTTNSGFSARARAMQIRWRWPPENSCGIAGLVERLQSAVVHDLINIIVEFCLGNQVVFTDSLADDLSYRQARGQDWKTDPGK